MGALPSKATRGHWFPQLELEAAPAFGPVPHLLEQGQPRLLLSPSSPEANTDPRRREEDSSQSILHSPAGEGWELDLGSGPQSLFWLE